MATIRSGRQPVLVVVDVQMGVMRDGFDAPRVIANVALAIDKARTDDVPVVWVQHQSDELPHGSAAWQWVPQLVPATAELRIDKRYPSSFEDTGLEAELTRLHATRIVLAGAQSNWCIRATAYAALERGYDLTLISDAHTTDSVELEDGQRIEAKSVVGDLNQVLHWLAYPGRSSTTVPVAELAFSGS